MKNLQKLSKNNFYYDQLIIDEHLNKINKLLINNNDLTISMSPNWI